MLATVALVQGGATVATMPYRLDHYNPLLGGIERARGEMQLGWGQGGRSVARFLIPHLGTDREQLIQGTHRVSPFSYHLPEDTNARLREARLESPADWYETDWYVTGIQQTQRDIASGYELLQAYEPVHVVEVEGIIYFEVYTPSALPLPDQLRRETACTMEVGDSLRLMQVVLREEHVDLYWITASNDIAGRLEVTVVLSAPGHAAPATTVGLEPAEEGHLSRARVPVPDIAPGAETPEVWTVDITVRDPATGEVLPVTSPTRDAATTTGTTNTACHGDAKATTTGSPPE